MSSVLDSRNTPKIYLATPALILKVKGGNEASGSPPQLSYRVEFRRSCVAGLAVSLFAARSLICTVVLDLEQSLASYKWHYRRLSSN